MDFRGIPGSANRISVEPIAGRWAILKNGQFTNMRFDRKDDAVKKARSMAKTVHNGRLEVLRADGTVQDSFDYSD